MKFTLLRNVLQDGLSCRLRKMALNSLENSLSSLVVLCLGTKKKLAAQRKKKNKSAHAVALRLVCPYKFTDQVSK